MAGSFKDLVVWQRAIELSLAVYRLTSDFPRSEQFGLTNQLRRAGVSVASNIAEGYGRASRGEYFQFVGHARGSVNEIQTQLMISRALNFGSEPMRASTEKLSEDVSRLLNAMMRKLSVK